MMRRSLITPSYAQGFARSQGDAQHPGLWRGLVGAWVPSLGASGATLYDVSGFNRHGTLVNIPISTGWIPGGLYFDGVNDFVNCGTSPAGGLTALSVSAWVRPDDSAGDRMVAEDGSGYTENAFFLNLNLGKPSFLVYADAHDAVTASSAVSTTALTHIVGTWQAGSRCNIYVNGQIDNATPSGSLQSTALKVGNQQLTLGGRPEGGSVSLDYAGDIGLFTMHNRALSPAESRQLYMDPLAPFRLRDRRAFVFIAAVTDRISLLEPRRLHGLLRR